MEKMRENIISEHMGGRVLRRKERFREFQRDSKIPEWSELRNKHCWSNQEFINEFLPGEFLVLLWKK